MSNQKEIGVIIPFYNASRFIKYTLDSLLHQEIDHNIYIVDDGSEDSESVKLDKICSNYKNIIRIRKKNGGLSSARNAALSNLNEKYLLFLDSDDLLGVSQLRRQYELISKDDADICLTGYATTQQDLSGLKQQSSYLNEKLDSNFIARYWERGLTIPIHTALFKAQHVKELKFNEDIKSKEDFDFWLRFFLSTRKIAYLEDYAAIYRVVKNSMSRDPRLSENSVYSVVKMNKRNICDNDYSAALANARINYGLWK